VEPYARLRAATSRLLAALRGDIAAGVEYKDTGARGEVQFSFYYHGLDT
jgi:hypothetical protein